MKAKVITLHRNAYADVFTLDDAPFICCFAVDEVIDNDDFISIQLGVSSTQPDTDHWIQLDTINSVDLNNGYVTALSYSPSCERYVSQRKRISAYAALRDFLSFSPHPIYLSFISGQ